MTPTAVPIMTATKVPRKIQRSMGISSGEGFLEKLAATSIRVCGQPAILHVSVRLKKPQILILRISIRHAGYIIANRPFQASRTKSPAGITFGKLLRHPAVFLEQRLQKAPSLGLHADDPIMPGDMLVQEVLQL